VNISTSGSSATSGDEFAGKLEHHPLGAVVRDLFSDVETLSK
jgi:hypothetical protein